MAVTFKILVRKDKMRADKTWNVCIRLTYNRQTKYLPTTEYVTKKDMTASFKIKNMAVLERCEELVREYKRRIAELNLELNDMDIDRVAEHLRMKRSDRGLSFTEYAEKWIEESDRKGGKNYRTAVNALRKFVGRRDIDFKEVDVKLMRSFEKSLADRPRAASLYTNSIVKIFNDAREYYNDEDNDVYLIRHSLAKYHAPRQNVAEKRALPVEMIRRIFELPYDNKTSRGLQSRHDLALDCFRLSFCLMGMNSADLWAADRMEGRTIVYCRAKTRDRRSDGAEMRVDVPERIRKLFRKYRDRKKKRVFAFYERFSTPESFNKSINKGLDEVAEELGLDGLQFYSARHSMATIALNGARIDKWIVNDMLCHTDPAMKVTELYIKRDFKPINEANERLMDFVFGKKD